MKLLIACIVLIFAIPIVLLLAWALPLADMLASMCDV